MEKICWIIIAVLWSGLVGSTAYGASGPHDPESPFSGGVMSVSVAALPLASPAGGGVNRRPVVGIGETGGGEVVAAFAVGGAALWCARRRRIV